MLGSALDRKGPLAGFALPNHFLRWTAKEGLPAGVDQESESSQLVNFRAERDGRVLTWDTHPLLAAALKRHLESEGWTVSISTDDPRRRRLPRIEGRRTGD